MTALYILAYAAFHIFVGKAVSIYSLGLGGDVSERTEFLLHPLSSLGWWEGRTLVEVLDFSRDSQIISHVLLVIFWPVKVVWNVVTILVLVPLIGLWKQVFVGSNDDFSGGY